MSGARRKRGVVPAVLLRFLLLGVWEADTPFAAAAERAGHDMIGFGGVGEFVAHAVRFLGKIFLAHMLFEIHGLVEDAGDFYGIVANAEEEHVFGTWEYPATCR